jgi:hypothetical protein
MKAISEAHLRLGAALRQTRETAGYTTRQVPKNSVKPSCFSSGHISLVENGCTTASPELVETYMKWSAHPAVLSALYDQVLAERARAGRRRRRPAGTAAAEGRPPLEPAQVLDREEVQRHYVVESNEARYRLDSNGVITEVNCTVALRARTPGVQLYYTGYNYSADARRGVLRVEEGPGGFLRRLDEGESGAVRAYFQLERQLLPSDAEAHRLSYRIVVDSEAQCIPRLRYHADSGSKELSLHVQFEAPAVPRRIWRFGVRSTIDAEYPEHWEAIAPSAPGSYSHVFDRLVPTWCYGFGWAW